MKKMTLMVTLVTVAVIGNGLVVQADEMERESIGRVSIAELSQVSPEITDPENPEEELTYPENTAPGAGRLQVVFASNFDFGEVEANGREQFAYSKLQNVTTSEGESYRVPFVSTFDMRGSERTPWDLTVSATDLSDGTGHVLRGAYITLEDMKYAGDSERAPKVTTESIDLTSTPQTIASASIFSLEDGTNDTGVGNWSLALGEQAGETSSGVRLTIPNNIVINDGVDYTATITWNLDVTP